MKLFLHQDIQDRVQEHAREMLRTGQTQRSIPLIAEPTTSGSPRFLLARQPDELVLLGSFEFEGVKFYLGVQP